MVFDTFMNPGAAHKDVALVSSDSITPAPKTLPADAPGCSAEFRYWEGRDDFSIANKSAARITFRNGRVSVYMDISNTGDWITCFEDAHLDLPPKWWTRGGGGHLGITATTGMVSDNHDILSVQVSQEAEPVPEDVPEDTLPALVSSPFLSSRLIQ